LGRGGRHSGQLGIIGTQVKACRRPAAGGLSLGAMQQKSHS
jgi:hypothetical protein